jgi:5-methylthioadenosine/S-adenosylhomocysteine deaminase
VREDAEAVPAAVALELATRNGYRALGFADGGVLREGALADLILVDLTGPHVRPVYRPHSALAYAAQAADVRTTIVDGHVLMHERTLTTLDEAEVYHHIAEIAARYRRN